MGRRIAHFGLIEQDPLWPQLAQSLRPFLGAGRLGDLWCWVGMRLSARRDRQVVRIVGSLKTLAEGGRPTVHQLAVRFKTRRETIYRDLHALEAVGYPIVGDESGRLSRPRLASEARPTLPPVALTRQETAALVWAAKNAGSRQPFHAVLPTALAKLQALAAGRE